MSENLIEGLRRELDRNREILGYYEEIPTGVFGAAMIRESIRKGDEALNNMDTVEMLRAFKDLQDTKA